MRVLLTNDDGINAQGLAALETIAGSLSQDVWVCAPESEQSGASRALTLAEPLRVRRLGERRFAVRGTPTDCVMLAIQELIEGAKPDLVLSGVNRGLNAAEDVSLSGTVAGAIEGMAMGVPSIALSQMMGEYQGDRRSDFEPAERFAPGLLARLIAAGWPPGVILNINFPLGPASRVESVEITRQGFRDVRTRFAERRTDLRGREYYWLGFRNIPSRPDQGTDLRAAYEGRISVTPLHIDLTHFSTLERLKGVVEGVLAEEPAPPRTART
ncbi:MAG TPA: 5'/3'-nucleotidase SurE [Caulobacteraceae bacterium]|jgi:5'-nucleotidase|nr:5'/3'-nucleotidase SurE [Caulobacteraceae bacterium]